MIPRSSRAEVRNPILRLPEAQRLAEVLADHPDAARAFRDLLGAIHRHAHTEADRAWRQRKPPVAAYWRAMGVYARHIRAAVATLRPVLRKGYPAGRV